MESYRALILIFNNLAIGAIFADFCIDKYDVYGQCSSTNLGKKEAIPNSRVHIARIAVCASRNNTF
jgi:hypothetical protein